VALGVRNKASGAMSIRAPEILVHRKTARDWYERRTSERQEINMISKWGEHAAYPTAHQGIPAGSEVREGSKCSEFTPTVA